MWHISLCDASVFKTLGATFRLCEGAGVHLLKMSSCRLSDANLRHNLGSTKFFCRFFAFFDRQPADSPRQPATPTRQFLLTKYPHSPSSAYISDGIASFIARGLKPRPKANVQTHFGCTLEALDCALLAIIYYFCRNSLPTSDNKNLKHYNI